MFPYCNEKKKSLKVKILNLDVVIKYEFGLRVQEVRKGRRAAQNIQSNQEPDEDVLDTTLGDTAVTANNLAFTNNEHEQVR